MDQGTDEWMAARLGKLTASRMADAVAKTKTGYGASRANLMAALVAERLTGSPAVDFVNAAMQWGTEKEPEARNAYVFLHDIDVVEVGFIDHPAIGMSGASPDGLVGEVGLIEIKCPNTANHIETLLGQNVPGKYITQMQWQMACTGRQWCDFASYDPRLPPEMALFVKRVPRDAAMIAELELEAITFLAELDATVSQLRQRYMRDRAA